ncbi:cell wall-binding repeat-containing protein [Hazenella sp. IB182353]|uniref:cell wall-binding repeat-containing protein n=1 Tax=Polycladospora coralii TaxID=2771432 RepID=UPI0017473A33|nr:cell wall-binding repeat-containing protein [Polycladospora coralii]MBS7529618.1 cell wall-binding repeat-containing protein [Polycladospora coralii]
MSINRKKLFTSALAVAVVSSSMLFPSITHADKKKMADIEEEILLAKKHETIQKIRSLDEQRESVLKNLKKSSKSSNAPANTPDQNVKEATFTGSIAYREIHVYPFDLAVGGEVKVEDINGSNLAYDFYNHDTDTYHEADTNLPAGKYSLEVYVLNEDLVTPQSYEIKVSNITFKNAPDSSAPKLNISSLDRLEKRLDKDTKDISLKGSHDADQAMLLSNSGQTQLSKNFDQKLPLDIGLNEMRFMAVENSGNLTLKYPALTVPGTKRLGGANRYDVSANISKEMFKGSESASTVIITRSDLYPDALSGGILAGLEKAPILLSDQRNHTLPAQIKEEVKRLKPERAIILGSTGSVGTQVEQELKGLGVQTIERIGGVNRFEVSANIATYVNKEIEALHGADALPDTAFIASGLKFPDALSASSPSASYFMPILQVSTDSIPSQIDNFIKNNSQITNFIIVGGPATVSDNILTKLESISEDRGGSTERIGGANRYEVSENIANYFGQGKDFHTFAKGTDFPDALSGTPLATSVDAPMILTPPNQVLNTTKEYLEGSSEWFDEPHDVFYLLGGEGSIQPNVANELSKFIK